MSVFLDSSALIGLLAENDVHHASARSTWRQLVLADEDLWTSNYVVVETIAALQRRVGIAAVRELRSAVLPAVVISWVTPEEHAAALAALVATNRRELSLVDCTSFVLMRDRGTEQAFAFGPHFAEQGFQCVPSPSSA